MWIVRRGILYIVLTAMGFGFAACESTIRGAGHDIDRTADAVGDAAADVAN